MNEDQKQCYEYEKLTKQSSESTEDIDSKYKLALYANIFSNSVSRGLVSPFVSMIALSMGAKAGLIGWIQSIANLLSTFLTPIFGRLSDMLKRRIPFVVFSTISWGVPYIFLYWAKSPIVVVFIVAIVNLLMSMGVPSWNALQNELFPPNVRARLSSRIFIFDAIGSMLAIIFTGIILSFAFGDIDYQKYILIPVSVGIVISIIAVLPFRNVEEPLKNMAEHEQPPNIVLRESFSRALRNPPFKKFLILSSVYSFFWSFAWPLFALKQIEVLKAKAYEVAILQIGFSIATLIAVYPGSKLSDKIGRTKLITFHRMIMATFTIAYIFASKVWHLYLVHIFIATLVMFGSTSNQAYLMDIAPKAEGGVYFGIYNMITGVFLFLGSLVGGYLTEITSNYLGLETALTISFIVATVGRLSVGALFATLKEVKSFPCTLGEVIQMSMRRRRLTKM